MKPQMLSLIVAIGFVAALAGAVRADDKPTGDRDKMGDKDRIGVKETQGDQSAGRYDGQFNGIRGTKLIGANVKNSAGKSLGDIKDVVVDPQSGRVAYAVLDFGGFLGIGNKLFAIPWRSLQMQHNDLVTMEVSKEQLDASTGFDQSNWPNMADQQWATETHRRFNQTNYWDVDIDVDERGADVDATKRRGTTGTQHGQFTALTVCKLSEIIGEGIENNRDENLGDVNDVVLDSSRGQIAYAVLGVGGFIGIGEDLIAVPWEKLNVRVQADDPDDLEIRLTMSKEELKDGPRFSKDKWPNADDKDYLIRVYTFYDTEPYWGSRSDRVSDARDR